MYVTRYDDFYKWYEEEIALKITSMKAGIEYGKLIIDILLYADDIILLASTFRKMQDMLDELTKFSITHQIRFNPSKTNVMTLNMNNTLDELKLCNEPIVQTDSFKYLGIEITNNYSNLEHIEKRTKAVSASIANLTTTGVLNKQLNICTKIRLYSAYLKPLIAYGSEIIIFSQDELVKMKRLEGNTIKKVIGVSKYCVSKTVIWTSKHRNHYRSDTKTTN